MNWQAIEATLEPRRIVFRLAALLGLMVLAAKLVVSLNLDFTNPAIIIAFCLFPALVLFATESVLETRVRRPYEVGRVFENERLRTELEALFAKLHREVAENNVELKRGFETQLASLHQELEQLNSELPIEIQTRQLTLLQAIQILQQSVEKSHSHLMTAFEAKIEAVQADFDALIEELSASTSKRLKELRSALERNPEHRVVRVYNVEHNIKEKAARLRIKEGHSVEQVASELSMSRGFVAGLQRKLFREYGVNSSRELAEAVRRREKAAE